MKTKKIRNIPREVCVSEQMVAYNMAFRAHINHGDAYKKAESEEEKAEKLAKIKELVFKDLLYGYDYKPGRFNEDAISIALDNGLADYLEKPFIASEYEQVGKAFPIPE